MLNVADEQRDAGEHEQERLEEVEEVGVDVLVVLLREVGAGDRLDTVGSTGRMFATSSSWLTPASAATSICETLRVVRA